ALYDEAISKLSPRDKSSVLRLECECDLRDLEVKVLTELENLAPFGPGNPEPLIGVRARVEEQSVLKGRHLKLRLGSGGVRRFEGIWFNGAENLVFTELVERSARDRVDCFFAGIPELNRFMGRVTPTLRIKDAVQS
ncbi:MAG: hypothetical protein EBX52_06340, partial [Proteobacteria bacterium]|nr:hypothetical protein [Pseudomonadota bacterium]